MLKPVGAVQRDQRWVEREYGQEKWPALLAPIEAELAAGESDLGRVVNRVRRFELRGGAERWAVFYALEYTASGRACTRRLATLQPLLDVRVLPFDFTNVDLTPLGTFAGRIVVFTSQAIEQIPQLSRGFFDALARRDVFGFNPDNSTSIVRWRMERSSHAHDR
jgi:hypothetical protein